MFVTSVKICFVFTQLFICRTTNFAIDAHMKWNSLFQECFSALGCHDGDKDVDPESAWRCADNVVQKNLGSSMDTRHQVFALDLVQQKKKNYKEYMKMANSLKALQELLSKVILLGFLLSSYS